MANFPLDPAYRRVSVREFLALNLGDAKAELIDGLIMLKAYGTARHAAIIGNLLGALVTRLRGTGCRAYGSDLGVRTGEATIRFPDISIYCRDDNPPMRDDAQLLGDPRVIFEVLSPETASNDQITKLTEYRGLPGLHAVVFADPEVERVRVIMADEKVERRWLPAGSALELPMLGLTLPHSEIFERS